MNGNAHSAQDRNLAGAGVRPKVLLLDEPLGALDLKLREQMQEELKALQKQLGITFVFVTHDQGEALSMANRVAIFNDGKIVQEGTPNDVYERPRSRFVADFVGSSNLLPPEFAMAHGGTKAWTSLRPEKIKVVAPGEPFHGNHHTVSGHIISIQYQGAVTRISTDVEGTRIAAVVPTLNDIFKEGDPVQLAWGTHNLVAMDAA